MAALIAACGQSKGAPASSSAAAGAGNSAGGGAGGGGIPADYKVTVKKGDKLLATFTTDDLERLGGRGGHSRGPGPTLADVLTAAKVDAGSGTTLVIDGFTGDHIETPLKDALDEPGGCEIFVTRRSTAKLTCGSGQVRHVATIAVT
jgi:hypothetical protein